MIFVSVRKVMAVLLLVTTLLGTLFCLPTAAEDAATVRVTIPLDTPIELTLEHSLPSPEGEAELRDQLSALTQPVFDALIRDYPLDVMWVDVSACKLNFTYSPIPNTNKVLIKSLKYEIAILPTYTDPKGMTDQVKHILDSFTPQGNTLYEKIKSIHDFVCRMATYDASGSYIFSAYGSLVNRLSVCEGYAEAFKLLCEKNDIDCVLITGTAGSQNENHMWAYVRMDDNRWYAVDPTWDDGRGDAFDHRYFLVGSDTTINGTTTFSQNHHPIGDISHTGYYTYTYPELSVNAYLVNHPDGTADGEYPTGQSHHYFYQQLTSDLQRTLYTSLLHSVQNQAPSFPDATPTPAPTDDLTTQSPTSEPLPPVTSMDGEDTTVSAPPTESDLSTSETVTESESISESVSESETITETESDAVTETESSTETESDTATETDTETVTESETVTDTESETVTDTESETATETVPPNTTEPPKETTLPPTLSTEKQTTPITSLPTETVPTSDTTTSPPSESLPMQSSQAITTGTVSITVTPPPASVPPNTQMISLIEILRVAVIVITLLTVFTLVVIVIIKTQNHEKK